MNDEQMLEEYVDEPTDLLNEENVEEQPQEQPAVMPEYVTREDLNTFAQQIATALKGNNQPPQPAYQEPEPEYGFADDDYVQGSQVKRVVEDAVQRAVSQTIQQFAPVMAPVAHQNVARQIAGDLGEDGVQAVIETMQELNIAPQNVGQITSNPALQKLLRNAAIGAVSQKVSGATFQPAPKGSPTNVPQGQGALGRIPEKYAGHYTQFKNEMGFLYKDDREARKAFLEFEVPKLQRRGV